jgi:LPXTG-motif cell wall-anchored protein
LNNIPRLNLCWHLFCCKWKEQLRLTHCFDKLNIITGGFMKRINLTKRNAAALGLGVILAMAPLAMAQEAAPPPDPGAAGGTAASSTANDPGSIDTSQRTVTTTTTTKTGGGSYQVVGGDTDTAPLPNTGGEPLLFVLAGSMLIGGGWVLRRKMAQGES